MSKERVDVIVTRLGEALAEQLGYELVEVEYHKEGPDWILRCTIDSDQGITTDDCQRFSVALEKALDEADPIPGSYLLEISSPGIERPLKKERDYQRFVHNQVEIKLFKALNNQKAYRGELLGLSNQGSEVLVLLKISDELSLEIPLKDIVKARLIPEIFANEGGIKKK